MQSRTWMSRHIYTHEALRIAMISIESLLHLRKQIFPFKFVEYIDAFRFQEVRNLPYLKTWPDHLPLQCLLFLRVPNHFLLDHHPLPRPHLIYIFFADSLSITYISTNDHQHISNHQTSHSGIILTEQKDGVENPKKINAPFSPKSSNSSSLLGTQNGSSSKISNPSNTNCGCAAPEVRFLISSLKPKDSATGSSETML